MAQFSLGIYIAALGALGVLSRFTIDQFAARLQIEPLWATGTINLVGSFIAGIIFVCLEKNMLKGPLGPALLVGFCGGFTTFSAFALQSATLLFEQKERAIIAIIYLICSPLSGLVAILVAIRLARALS